MISFITDLEFFNPKYNIIVCRLKTSTYFAKKEFSMSIRPEEFCKQQETLVSKSISMGRNFANSTVLRYSSNEIRKAQNEHLNIMCKNLNDL